MPTRGPLVVDRRPRSRRPCLGCGKRIETTRTQRLCKLCTLRAAGLAGGVEEVSLLGALTGGRRL